MACHLQRSGSCWRGIIGMDGIGAGIHAFLNRLLIPTGLHHAEQYSGLTPSASGDLQNYW